MVVQHNLMSDVAANKLGAISKQNADYRKTVIRLQDK
jgi:hypothetical protein